VEGILNRRDFNGLCVALSSFVTSLGASALDVATGAGSTDAGRTVKFRDGTVVPALGQGSAGLGKGRHPQAHEEEALRTGHVAGNGIARACEASLARLGTDHLDLYLLHWPNGVTDLSGVVTAFEIYAWRGRFVPGACPISRSTTWKPCSIFHKAIVARLIRSLTA
jgi:Aldo/keto reductase family